MKRIPLFPDETQHPASSPPQRLRCTPNPWDEQLGVESLLLKMRCVMWDEHAGRWDARAQGCQYYAHGDTPEAAMRAALLLLRSTPRRKILE